MVPVENEHNDIPLVAKYESLAVEREVKRALGVRSATDVAISVALYEAHQFDRAVSYSRSRNYYDSRNTHPLLTYRKTLRSVASLEDGNLIEHFRQKPGVRGYQSWMRATDKLVNALEPILADHSMPLLVPANGIQLRDVEKVPLVLPRTREVGRMNKKVRTINEAVTSVQACEPSGMSVSASVARIFNSDLNRGGRFYANGVSWQNVTSETRKRITIDGEPVVELDYATLHPAMLYAEAQCPLPEDCYALPGWPRKLVKLAFLILLNAKSEAQARQRIAQEPLLGGADFQSRISRAATLIAAIKGAHQPIARWFHSDVGARLMRRDSELAQAVMLDLIGQGIVALPVHDSFLVPASKRDQLETAMQRAAHRIGLAQIRVEDAAI